ncbi:hypothetical protein PRIPAC_78681 [Pristionchus pacificus]|uniref:Uncharacterized protein n=1 Tax=Pristionchus pacificus TaxID=54126 RepID=A0A2A6CN17_PRIPA|nr:hypothetical protein PRIPAC_78681 [Pristionchus pacificus]|eukprot:PDM79453.1 hypothetical protein PRIPAC_32032 [Pristionchus pacificus]
MVDSNQFLTDSNCHDGENEKDDEELSEVQDNRGEIWLIVHVVSKIIKLLETLHVKLDSKPQCECNQLRQELMELKKMLGKSAEQPPPPLDTYSAVKMAINDAAAYSEKAKRAVWVGRPEESTPELTLASDQKAIEELCAELNDGSLSQALTAIIDTRKSKLTVRSESSKSYSRMRRPEINSSLSSAPNARVAVSLTRCIPIE